jgi:hypothetical protein
LYTLVDCPGGSWNFKAPGVVGVGTFAPCAKPKLAQRADTATSEIDDGILQRNTHSYKID